MDSWVRTWSVPGLAIGLLVAASWGVARPEPDESAREEFRTAASQFVTRLSRGEFAAALESGDLSLRRQWTADKLGAQWRAALDRAGTFQRVASVRLGLRPTGNYVTVTCDCDREALDVRLSLSDDKQVISVQFLPPPLGGPGLIRASANMPVKAVKDGAVGTVTFPVPGLYRDQVPVGFAVRCEPPVALQGYTLKLRPDGLNWLCEVKVAPPEGGAVVSWESLVLVGDRPPVALPPAARPEFPPEAGAWLRSTACVQSQDQEIRATAEELARGAEDVGEFARRVAKFTAERPLDERRLTGLDAKAALASGGSCTSRANLAAALLRARGVPARTVAHLPTWAGQHYEHWLVEYWHPGVGWVWLESSLNQLQPPPWTAVVLNVASPEDENLAFDRLHCRAVARGAPHLAVIEITADLAVDYARRTVGNSATPEVRLQAMPEEWKALWAAARQAHGGLVEKGEAGAWDGRQIGRLLAAARTSGATGLARALQEDPP
jgi:hypothetical protein